MEQVKGKINNILWLFHWFDLILYLIDLNNIENSFSIRIKYLYCLYTMLFDQSHICGVEILHSNTVE